MQGEGPAGGRPETQDPIRGVVGEQGRVEGGMVELCESVAQPGLEPVRAQGPAGGRPETQDPIRGVIGDLRRIEGHMVEICESLPEPDDEFEPLAELCGVVDCVNHDLIADAIRTLELAASHDEAELRREYEQRQRFLAIERRIRDGLL